MDMLAQREKCVSDCCIPMCHRLDNSLSFPPFTVISTHPAPVIYHSSGRKNEYEIKQINLLVYLAD